MNVSLSEALDTLGEFAWVLLVIVAFHAAVQVRKYQDIYPPRGLEGAIRGALATVWFGVGSALVQAAILREPIESLTLPVAACLGAYAAVSFCPADSVYRVAQTPAANALLIIGMEVCRAMCVGVGVTSARKVYSGQLVPGLMGALRGVWGWAFGRPGAKVLLGRSLGEITWNTPQFSTPASTVAAALLAVSTSREDAEKVIGGLIALLVAWRSYELSCGD